MDKNSDIWREIRNIMAYAESSEAQAMKYIGDRKERFRRVADDGPSSPEDRALAMQACAFCVAIQSLYSARTALRDAEEENDS